ncbi:hypothetical protein EDB82DRAFT_482278 [Fusarium venenatum]|uniref:uncharacterized protein n=1 Tax=Fusarium venenatum TaxID=56646 RepID=UPI001DBD77A0|nr:hypothetical protein EDB82DRAFT_482278 [Fusarium venenatum]
MGASTPHPSQRRISCDLCRKSKSRCQRIRPTDEKCAKCAMLGAECTVGQQRVPGRPRRKQPAKRSTSTTQSVNKSTWPVSPPTPAQPNTSFLDDWSLLDTTGILYPTIYPAEKPSTTRKDVNTTTCCVGFIDVFHQSDSSWTTDVEYTNTPFYNEMDMVTELYTTGSSPIPTLPLAINNDVSLLSNCSTTQYRRNIEPGDSMASLSAINHGLYVRIEAIKKNRKAINFDTMICQHGPLFIDNMTLFDYINKVTQEFLFVLVDLYGEHHCPEFRNNSQPMELLCPCHLATQFLKDPESLFQISLPQPTTTAGPLPTPVALTITSVFVQLITIYELVLNHIATKVERLTNNPMESIPALIVCGRLQQIPCTQGVIFCDVSVSLIESIERVLGVGKMLKGKEVGLLSPRQVDILREEMDERQSFGPGHTVMAPATLRKLIGKVAGILRRIRW